MNMQFVVCTVYASLHNTIWTIRASEVLGRGIRWIFAPRICRVLDLGLTQRSERSHNTWTKITNKWRNENNRTSYQLSLRRWREPLALNNKKRKRNTAIVRRWMWSSSYSQSVRVQESLWSYWMNNNLLRFWHIQNEHEHNLAQSHHI